MRITWDDFEQYSTCPRQYCWDKRTDKPKAHQQKDTQYLSRGNAIQHQVERFLANPSTWTDAWQDIQDKIVDNTLNIVQEEITKQSISGTPGVTALELSIEVKTLLKKQLPEIRRFVLHLNDGTPPQKVEVQKELEYTRKGVNILGVDYPAIKYACRADVLITLTNGTSVLLEGKSTRYTDRIKDDQVRWQADSLMGVVKDIIEKQPDSVVALPAPIHYFVCYHTGEFKEVRVFTYDTYEGLNIYENEKQRKWLNRRDHIIYAGILAGVWDPLPTSLGCKVCKFRDMCPDYYKPNKGQTAFPGQPTKGFSIQVM